MFFFALAWSGSRSRTTFHSAMAWGELFLAVEADAGLVVLVNRAALGLGQELADVLVVGLELGQRGERLVRSVVVLPVEEILAVAVERDLLEGQSLPVGGIAGQEFVEIAEGDGIVVALHGLARLGDQ